MTGIPLTVIGGYLGSGKTTLLNEMLDRRDGRRIAVIVNDFGQINIDARILGERDGRTWEIANGCICCDLSDGMAAAIESIRSADPPPTSVFVEVSGVGQPDVVARWGDHPGFVRGGATVCVDVLAIRSQVHRRWIGDTVAAQLRGADRFVLTKTDLASADQIAEVRDWLTTMSDAEVIERETAVTGDLATSADETAAAGPAQPVPAPDHDVRAAGAHRSWTFTVDAPVDREHLRAVFEGLPAQFVRAKGILDDRCRDGHRFAFDFDGARFDSRDFGQSGDEECHLVLIAARTIAQTTPAQTHDRPDDGTEAAVEAIAQVLGAAPRS